MKLQGLTVIFVLIVLPMSIILSAYTHNQIKTLSLQVSYDSKLMAATSDAVKAFQVNTLNDSTSNSATSKIRDIEASVESFYNSIAENFQISEGNKEAIKYYTPALVYTLYDGFYIYSMFDNITNPTGDEKFKINESVTYQDESQAKKIYGLKPYVYYSCRYKPNSESDFVITYSLDNYITIQGKVDGKHWNVGGYLIDGVKLKKNSSGKYTFDGMYNGIKIDGLETKEIVNEYKNWSNPDKSGYNTGIPYIQENGTKYYYYYEDDSSKTELQKMQIFSIISGKKQFMNSAQKEEYVNKVLSNDNSYNYYKLAAAFTRLVRDTPTLRDLKPSDAFEINDNESFKSNFSIFGEESGKYIEESDSNFNEHRTAVIRYAIQKNLSAAITNYNSYAISDTANYEFQMPELSETEWYSIINHISLISFLQGLPIGGKIYNGHSVVVNNKNKEVVSDEAIYIPTVTSNEFEYHKANAEHLITDAKYASASISEGILNINFERRSYIDEDTLQTMFFYPKEDLACYDCVINTISTENDDILKLMRTYAFSSSSRKKDIAKCYYIGLGRERYGMSRTSYEIYANNFDSKRSTDFRKKWKYIEE